MTVHSTTTSQQAHNFATTDQIQKNAGSPPLLQLDIELLKLILGWMATGSNSNESARNAIRFGQVCTLTHLLTHSKEIQEIIEQEKVNIATIDLAKAIVKRRLTNAEFGNAKMPVDGGIRATEKAKCAVLHLALKEKTSKSGIQQTSDEYAGQVVAIQQNIRELCKKMITEQPDEARIFGFGLYLPNEKALNIKTFRAIRTFTKKVINDMSDGYAAQPLSAITMESYWKITGLITQLNKNLEVDRDGQSYSITDAATLLTKIRAKHSTKELNTASSGEFYEKLLGSDNKTDQPLSYDAAALDFIVKLDFIVNKKV